MCEIDRKSYEEMLARARAAYPDGQIPAWEVEGAWSSEDVDPSWAATPAERVYRDWDPPYGNRLMRWAHKNGYESQPLTLIAFYYNLSYAQRHLQSDLRDRKLKKEGFGEWWNASTESIFDDSIEVPSLTDEERGAIDRIIDEAEAEALEIIPVKFQDSWADLW